MIQGGVPVGDLQDQLGHALLATTDPVISSNLVCSPFSLGAHEMLEKCIIWCCLRKGVWSPIKKKLPLNQGHPKCYVYFLL